jgi:hypothetical protein
VARLEVDEHVGEGEQLARPRKQIVEVERVRTAQQLLVARISERTGAAIGAGGFGRIRFQSGNLAPGQGGEGLLAGGAAPASHTCTTLTPGISSESVSCV